MRRRPVRPKRFKKPMGPRMNHRIRVPQIRLIGSDGSQKGVYATEQALKLAQSEALDLVEVDPNAKPPVCKIIDYGKYKYQQQKKQHENKKHQVIVHLKEIKMRPNIDEHDILFKVNHARRFLESKDKAKITIQFRGREMQHKERGSELVNRVIEDLQEISEPEAPPKMEGRNLTVTLLPKK